MEEMTELMAAAVSLHELYTAYIEAGFTEEQALRLVTALMNRIPPAAE